MTTETAIVFHIARSQGHIELPDGREKSYALAEADPAKDGMNWKKARPQPGPNKLIPYHEHMAVVLGIGLSVRTDREWRIGRPDRKVQEY